MSIRLPFVVVAGLALALALETDDVSGRDLSLGHEPQSILWNQTVPLNPRDPCLPVSGSVESRGAAIGPDQNPVAVGEVPGLSRVVVVKYDRRTGERMWCNSFPVKAAAANRTTFLVPFAKVGGVAIDASGTIFIGGDGGTAPFPPPPPVRPGLMPESPVNRYFVTKCSSEGACASTVTFINPRAGDSHTDTIGGIAVGPDGNPVLTGIAAFPSPFSRPSTFKLLTVKVDGSGFSLLGQAQAPSNPPIMASSEGVAVDSSNNIFVTGTEASTSKYDSLLSPKPLWTNRPAGARIVARSDRDHEDEFGEGRESGVRNHDYLATADHDEHGGKGDDEDDGEADEVAVIRTAVHAVNATADFEVIKLDGETGAALWAKTYDSGFNDIPRDVALDRSGNILVAGDLSRGAGQSVSLCQHGQLVSFSRTGKLNWVAGFPTRSATCDPLKHSFFSVAVGLDRDPVVSGYSEVGPAGPARVMDTIKYTFHDDDRSDGDEHDGHGHDGLGRDGDGHDGDEHRNHPMLLWDEARNQTVTGFRVCIDAQTGTECQDVGKPRGHTFRSTTAGSLTYGVALKDLTSLTVGRHTISVVAYNAGANSGPSESLSVRRKKADGRNKEEDGPHTDGKRSE